MLRAAFLLVLVVALGAGGYFAYQHFRQPPAPEQPGDPKGGPPVDPVTGKPQPKLVVLVVFDQMRGDYLEKWRDLFGAGGFRRLQSDGAWFTDCHYPYGTTTTGPGHASMLSGTCGDRHGIVNNNWYERGGSVYCAGSNRYEFVPKLPRKASDDEEKTVGNPDRMLAETVADSLRATHPGAKVFGLSLKDRSAILPTGKKPDGAYWFVGGRFRTSTYYADRVHPWVERFNASGLADQWHGKEWARFRTDVDYDKHAGPDKTAGEGVGASVKEGAAKGWSQGVTFPHPMSPAVAKTPGPEYYGALANSPFGNDLLLALAKDCVREERLGADDVPDLLVVSFSSNDLIGHTWGMDSQEVLDVTLRSDAVMADFLAFLDDKVGRGKYLVGVTADHGVCPLPEASRARGLDAKRVDPKDIQKGVEEHLSAKFGAAGAKKAWIEAASLPWLHFNPAVAAAAGKSRADVARAAADYLKGRPEVARAFTREDLSRGFPADDEIGSRMRRSYHPARCGDVGVVLKPYYLPGAALGTGTTHGAPYAYDTHVPFLAFGPGIPGGVRTEPTTPQALAAVFARWLGVRNPDKAEFPVPQSLGGN